jgi:cell division septum initiation protein DivIVA
VSRAAAVTREADAHLESAQQRADDLLQEARTYAERLITQAISRAREISRETEEFVAAFMQDAEGRLEETRRQKMALSDYIHKLRLVSNEIDLGSIEVQANAGEGMRSIQQAEIVEE